MIGRGSVDRPRRSGRLTVKQACAAHASHLRCSPTVPAIIRWLVLPACQQRAWWAERRVDRGATPQVTAAPLEAVSPLPGQVAGCGAWRSGSLLRPSPSSAAGRGQGSQGLRGLRLSARCQVRLWRSLGPRSPLPVCSMCREGGEGPEVGCLCQCLATRHGALPRPAHPRPPPHTPLTVVLGPVRIPPTRQAPAEEVRPRSSRMEGSRDTCVFLAKLAEQAERYDEMVGREPARSGRRLLLGGLEPRRGPERRPPCARGGPWRAGTGCEPPPGPRV